MRNEDVVATIVQAINEGPIVKRLDKINGTLEDHARHLAAHDTELAVLQRNQHCDASLCHEDHYQAHRVHVTKRRVQDRADF